MSNLLKEKCSLTKLREELEGRRGKLCRCCEKFRHLACNCRNGKEGEKGIIIPQNKFEVLKTRVMQCGVEGKTIRRQETIVVECFKYEGYCKGTLLEVHLVMWVGSHLWANILLITFSHFPSFFFCVISCDSCNSIIGLYVIIS